MSDFCPAFCGARFLTQFIPMFQSEFLKQEKNKIQAADFVGIVFLESVAVAAPVPVPVETQNFASLHGVPNCTLRYIPGWVPYCAPRCNRRFVHRFILYCIYRFFLSFRPSSGLSMIISPCT